MRDLQTFVARIGKSYWVLLRQSFDGWDLLIWGRDPLSRTFATISEIEAKRAASKAAKEHLKRHGLGLELADLSELSWRVAVRYIPQTIAPA
jgi:hypothetical protein